MHRADPTCKLYEYVLCFTVLHEACSHVKEVDKLNHNHLSELVLGEDAANCKAKGTTDKSSGGNYTPPLTKANKVHAL